MSAHELQTFAAGVIPGPDVLSLVAARGGRCTVFELRAAAARTFGAEAVFGNCHGDRFGFDALLAFFERKGKIAVAGDEVRLGASTACSGH
jgi:probable metal-binding protein